MNETAKAEKKSRNSNLKPIVLYVPKSVHQALKIGQIRAEKENLGEYVEELLRARIPELFVGA